jgi:Transglycosylase-like domain/LysM domain
MPAHARRPAHARPPRSRIRLTLITALAVLAAALTAVSLASSSAGATAGHPARAVTRTASLAAARDVAARDVSLSTAAQASALRAQAALRLAAQARTAAAAMYTVRAGQSLSGIAAERCGTELDWTGLYAANRELIGTDPDQISAGQVLRISCYDAPGVTAPATITTASVTPASTEQAAYSSGSATASGYGGNTPGGSFGQCVVARESGGNAQAMNSTSHYGLYQFSESTWEEYGGSASDFGDASVARQEQVFANALAQSGESNWSAYDGC